MNLSIENLITIYLDVVASPDLAYRYWTDLMPVNKTFPMILEQNEHGEHQTQKIDWAAANRQVCNKIIQLLAEKLDASMNF